MNGLTLFKAFEFVSHQKASHVAARPMNNIGIACDDDYHAQRWQRLNRIENKLYNRLAKALGDTRDMSDACWYCGGVGWHESKCKEDR